MTESQHGCVQMILPSQAKCGPGQLLAVEVVSSQPQPLYSSRSACRRCHPLLHYTCCLCRCCVGSVACVCSKVGACVFRITTYECLLRCVPIIIVFLSAIYIVAVVTKLEEHIASSITGVVTSIPDSINPL